MVLESGAAGTACSPAGTIVRFGLGRHVLRVNIRVLGCGIEQRPRRQEGVKRDPPGVSYRMKSEGKVFFLCREVRASRQRGQRVVAGVEDSRCTIHVNFGTTQSAGIFIILSGSVQVAS